MNIKKVLAAGAVVCVFSLSACSANVEPRRNITNNVNRTVRTTDTNTVRNNTVAAPARTNTANRVNNNVRNTNRTRTNNSATAYTANNITRDSYNAYTQSRPNNAGNVRNNITANVNRAAAVTPSVTPGAVNRSLNTVNNNAINNNAYRTNTVYTPDTMNNNNAYYGTYGSGMSNDYTGYSGINNYNGYYDYNNMNYGTNVTGGTMTGIAY